MPIRVPPTLPTAAHPLGGDYTQVSLRAHELFPMFVPRRHSEKQFHKQRQARRLRHCSSSLRLF